MKKQLIIIVPGPKYIKSKNKKLQKLILEVYSLFKEKGPLQDNYFKLYSKRLKSENIETACLNWGRNILISTKWLAVQKLKRLIRRYQKKYSVSLVGISLGGELALEAAKKFDEKTIGKIFLIAPTIQNPYFSFKKIPIINFFSSYDPIAKMGAKLYSPLIGSTKIKKGRNINIPKFTHFNFCLDSKIKHGKYKGKRISDLIKPYLK